MNRPLSGLSAWLVQRLSALYLLFFTLAATLMLLPGAGVDYMRWRALFTQPVISIAVSLFFIALLLHAWVGVRDIILDYAGRDPLLRLLLLSLLGVWLLAMGVWALQIVFGGMG